MNKQISPPQYQLPARVFWRNAVLLLCRGCPALHCQLTCKEREDSEEVPDGVNGLIIQSLFGPFKLLSISLLNASCVVVKIRVVEALV